MDNPKKHGAPAADSAATAASNKRFKHFHEGPNAIAQGDEEQKQSAAAAAPAHASPIDRLCSNELGAVLDFLEIVDLSRALSVSRSWSAFIRSSMPCARFAEACTAESVVEMSSSALARHITFIEHSPHSAGARCKRTSDSLSILARMMPHIVGLHCDLIPSKARKMILPAKLKRLELDLSALDADGINRAMEAIGQLTALSHLTLVLPSWHSQVSFAPLSKCAALRVLTIKEPTHVYWQTQPSDAQIDQFRALHHLRSVNLELFDSSSLTKLLRTPHSLQWTEMGGLSGVDGVGAAALRNLPGLLKLEAWYMRDVSFLLTLSQLQSLDLEIAEHPWAVTADALVESISSCSQLTYLSLLAPVTSKHLTLLLPHLTLLESLALCRCCELESLSFLNSVPSLQRSLRVFALSQCTHPALRSSELRHVQSLKHLSTLRLLQSFADPLDGFTQHLLSPPSTVLPDLTLFKYEPVHRAEPQDE